MTQRTLPDNFLHKTKEFINDNCSLCRDLPLIVALSGGADSIALLSVLHQLGYKCVAAHCNFHLRGDESNRDMLHCQSVTQLIGVDLIVRDFDVNSRMLSTGESVEVACRNLRYAWFNELLSTYGAQAVAVGHHTEDRAETFILNLMRGAGITGLSSMKAKNGSVVRPILWSTRVEIEDYLNTRQLGYVVDSSNHSDAHRRNRIRNHILPLMEEHFPGATAAIVRSVGNLESARELYNETVEAKMQKYQLDDTTINIEGLSAEPQATTLLLEMLHPFGFTPSQVRDMLRSANQSGQTFYSPIGSRAEQSRGMLKIYQTGEYIKDRIWKVDLHHDVTEPINIKITLHSIDEFSKEHNRSANVAYIDADFALAPNNRWELRRWQQGDRIVPFGGTKSKLVSDLFVAAKFDAQQKRDAWVLVCNGQIVWLPGLRNSAIGVINANTQRYLRLELCN